MTEPSERVSAILPSGGVSAVGGYAAAPGRPRLRAWLDEEGTIHLLRVCFLSPNYVWLESLDEESGSSHFSHGELWLEDRQGGFGPIRVESMSVRPSGAILGHAEEPSRLRLFVFCAGLDQVRRLAAYVAQQCAEGRLCSQEEVGRSCDWIGDAEEIRELMACLHKEQAPALVRLPDGQATVSIEQLDLSAGTFRTMAVPDAPDAPGCLEFSLEHARYEIPIGRLSKLGQEMRLPRWLTSHRGRRGRRARALPGTRVSFTHPWLPTLHVEAEVLDLSRCGLSFQADASKSVLYPGLELPRLELLREDGERALVRGRIRHCRASEGGLHAIGIEVRAGRDREGTFDDMVDAALYPNTHTRAVDAWAVYEESGYFNMSGKQPGDFAEIREANRVAVEKLVAAPDVASVVFWPAEGRPEATVSHFKLYESSWLIGQLSKRKGSHSPIEGRRGLREMYTRVFEVAQANEDTRWLVTFIQDTAPTWSRRIHVDVPKRYVPTGEACLLPFRALEAQVRPRSLIRLLGPESCTVTEAEGDLARQIMRDLCMQRPAQYLDALDLTEERWDLRVAKARWHAAGLERERALLVAHSGEERLALAVVECAQPGVHLYGLLDCLRMYPLRAGGERAFLPLFERAREWFGQRGRTRFVYLEEARDKLPAAELGLADMGGATLTFLSIRRLPELLHRVADLASERPSDRAAQRSPAERVA